MFIDRAFSTKVKSYDMFNTSPKYDKDVSIIEASQNSKMIPCYSNKVQKTLNLFPKNPK